MKKPILFLTLLFSVHFADGCDTPSTPPPYRDKITQGNRVWYPRSNTVMVDGEQLYFREDESNY